MRPLVDRKLPTKSTAGGQGPTEGTTKCRIESLERVEEEPEIRGVSKTWGSMRIKNRRLTFHEFSSALDQEGLQHLHLKNIQVRRCGQSLSCSWGRKERFCSFKTKSIRKPAAHLSTVTYHLGELVLDPLTVLGLQKWGPC